jgi:hypothetical protein
MNVSPPDASSREAPVSEAKLHSLTTEQLAVVQRPPSARSLIDAAAGTGKTATLCARVAFLIQDCGVPPVSIWLISFTRVAVSEIRNRLYSYVGLAAYSVRISTLDQQAFQIVQAFSAHASAKAFRDYELTIEDALGVLREGKDDLLDSLETLQHVLIDEAQDVVGKRAELVLLLAERLTPDCGISVFFDAAQAIYQFNQENGEVATLPDIFAHMNNLRFVTLGLSKIHRTQSVKLLSIFENTRLKVLSAKVKGESKFASVKADIENFCDTKLGKEFLEGVESRDDLLILFRSRGEAAKASGLLSSAGIRHRVRIAGYPQCLHAWLGIVFWDFTAKRLAKADFDKLLSGRQPELFTAGAGEALWSLLKSTAADGKDVVDMHQLRKVLSRDRPPIEYTSSDIGTTGPIVGTVHASKGREANIVHLHLPGGQREDTNYDEEASVLFVGATRARQSLHIGAGFDWIRQISDSCRSFHIDYERSIPTELALGLDGDLDPSGQASRERFATAEDAVRSQHVLQKLQGKQFHVEAKASKENGYTYGLWLGTQLVGHFDQSVNKDLFLIGRKLNQKRRHRASSTIPNVACLGVRTIVLPFGDPRSEVLLPPFRDSGIMLAPIICSFQPVRFYPMAGK